MVYYGSTHCLLVVTKCGANKGEGKGGQCRESCYNTKWLTPAAVAAVLLPLPSSPLVLGWGWREEGGGWGKWSDFLNTWGPLTCPSTGCSLHSTLLNTPPVLKTLQWQRPAGRNLDPVVARQWSPKTHQESRFLILLCPYLCYQLPCCLCNNDQYHNVNHPRSSWQEQENIFVRHNSEKPLH